MLFTFPSRYLFAIGLSVVFSLSGWSPIIQPEFLVFRPTQVPLLDSPAFAYGTLTLCGPAFQRVLLAFLSPLSGPITPAMPSDTAGLGYSPFARRYWGNRVYFLFLQVLRCFSSLRSPLPYREVPESLPVGCPIRTSAGHGAFATRRSFSQLVTSFFASESLGIPHAPFVVPFYPYPARLAASGLCQLLDKFDNVFAFDLLDCETFVSLLLSSRWFLTVVRNLASSLVIVLFQWRITDSNR